MLVREITDEIVARYRPEDAELARAMGVRSFVVVPFTSGPGRWARSCSSRPSRGGSSTTTTCCSRELGRRAGAAIENARLYQAMEQRARAAEALEFVGEGVLLVGGDRPHLEPAGGGDHRSRRPRRRGGRPPTRFPGGRSSRSASRWWTPATPSGAGARSSRSRSKAQSCGSRCPARFPDGTVYAGTSPRSAARAHEERLRLDRLARAGRRSPPSTARP